MAKNNDIEMEQIEQAFRNRINEDVKERTSKMAAQIREAAEKAAEAAERHRKRKLAREVVHCLAAVAAVACLYLAEGAGLISGVLTAPAYAIAFTSFGWHMSAANRMRGRK